MSPMRPTVLLPAIVLSGVAAGPVSGQLLTLDSPDRAFPQSFAIVQTVRELPDGRVLVADPLRRLLAIVDFDGGTMEPVGHEGDGPTGYRAPDTVWPLPGDSTLLVDLGNARLTRLGPDMGFGPTSPIQLSEPEPGREMILAIPLAIDGRGHIHTRSAGTMGVSAPASDSVAIVRLDRVTMTAEPVAMVKREDRQTRARGRSAINQSVEVTAVPLSPEDAFGVAADGRVAVARVGDYHLEWHAVDGSVIRGPAIAYEPVPVRTAEKEQWARERNRAGGGIEISVEITNGSTRMSFARGGLLPDDEDLDRYDWPAVKPPFYAGPIPVDGLDRAWVRRHLSAVERPVYDVFGADGRRLGSVRLPANRQVVGFGDGVFYAVAWDDFNLAYLERYSLPRL